MSNPQNPLFCQGKFGKQPKRLHMKLLVIVWHTIVYNNASITFYVPHISPTAIFSNIKICPPRIPDILLLIDSTGHVQVPYIRWIPIKRFGRVGIRSVPRIDQLYCTITDISAVQNCPRQICPYMVGTYISRYSPGQPHMIVMVPNKCPGLDREHITTPPDRYMDIQRIYRTYTCP